ncbi:MAG: ATP-binding protein [Candidatus Nealsonbacteria bacterium]
MKIIVAGSHSVGKTTFAKALSEKLGLNYIYDVVREEAVPKGFIINENTPPEIQFWLAARQWELETLTPQDWIADKSLFDYVVYGELVLKDEKVKEVIKELIERNAKYDFVFYLPIEFPMENDGVRSPDLGFQKNIDTRYRAYLDKLGVKYIILSGSVEDRVNQAISHIKN